MFTGTQFFPLPLRADLELEETSVADRSNQVVKQWVYSSTVRCLFMTHSGNKISSPREEFEQIDAMYTDPFANVVDGMRVVNIKDASGNIIESGPLYVQSVKRFVGFGGKVHHLSVKLRGRSQ